MAHAQIACVDTYEDADAIREFVRASIEGAGDLPGFLSAEPRLVVVKPNWVQQAHEYQPDLWEPVITHPVVVRTVVECLADAMGGQGTLVVCDAPHTYASFDQILARGDLETHLDKLRQGYPGITFELIDLRREVWIAVEQVVVERRPNPPDPRGYVALNLGRNSLFHGHHGEGKYYGADYDMGVVNAHHHGDTQEYLLAGTPMACDLFVNVPKLKTHKKTGLTCCLKNLVGINGDKNWLPHHTEGTPRSGGDEFPKESVAAAAERAVKRVGRRAALKLPVVGPWLFRKMRSVGAHVLGDSESTVRNGNWHGNDTCWRMALDLNRAMLYGNMDGTWREPPETIRYLAIIDGIIGGQGSGPLCPDAVNSGVLVGGDNPAVADAVAAKLMGFDPSDLPIVIRAFDDHRWPIADRAMASVRVGDGRVGATIPLEEVEAAVPGGFEPHFGWLPLRHEKG
ncbi:MAG: DUF362 domain-containing protein [bacterium]|nr:DUF362 domain-containing protein [bacterium]